MRTISSLLISLAFMTSVIPAMGYAQTFSDVQYSGGHPTFQAEKSKGTLNLGESSVEFKTQDGQSFTIPYSQLDGYEYQSNPQHAMLLFGAPNPYVMAGTAAFSAVSFLGAKARSRNHSRLTLKYRDDSNAVHAIQLMLANDYIQRQVVGDMALHIQQYQNALRSPENQVFDLRAPEEAPKQLLKE